MKSKDTSVAGLPVVGNFIAKPVRHDREQFAALVADAVAKLEEALALPGLMDMNQHARKRVVKPRPGSQAFINAMASAAALHPGQVGGDIDPQAMTDTLSYLTQLAPLKHAVDRLQARVDDTLYGRLSGAWREAMDVYTSLKRHSETHPGIVPAIADLGTYFRASSRGKHPDPVEKVESAPAPETAAPAPESAAPAPGK